MIGPSLQHPHHICSACNASLRTDNHRSIAELCDSRQKKCLLSCLAYLSCRVMLRHQHMPAPLAGRHRRGAATETAPQVGHEQILG